MKVMMFATVILNLVVATNSLSSGIQLMSLGKTGMAYLMAGVASLTLLTAINLISSSIKRNKPLP